MNMPSSKFTKKFKNNLVAILSIILLIWNLGGSLSVQATANGASPSPKHWSQGLPLKPTRVIEFTTDEGTDMSVDVSPDGKTIVFDLLGDLYTLPITGGEAKRITSGIAIDSIPRWAPDGRTIAFGSDRSGLANVWTVNADGTALRQVTKFTDLLDPASPMDFQSLDWTSDGRSVVALTLPPLGFAGAASHFIKLDIDSGRVADLTPGLTEKRVAGGTSEKDGAFVWFGGNPGLTRIDTASGRADSFANATMQGPSSCNGDLASPALSPDGRWLAYRMGSRQCSELRLHDLGVAGLDRDTVLTDETSQPALTARAYNRYEPRFVFTPDSKSIVYVSFGKIRRIDLKSRRITDIPFTAQVRAELAPLVGNPPLAVSGAMQVKQLRTLNSTADGKRTVFSALSKIWIQDAGGKPRRLSADASREYDPVLSPDGQWIAFVTWSFKGGKLWKVPAAGGPPVELAASTEAFTTPRWTPDGSQVVALRLKQNSKTQVPEALWPEQLTLIRVAADNGQPADIVSFKKRTAMSFTRPALTISQDGQRVYFVEGGSGQDEYRDPILSSVRLDGGDKRQHAKVPKVGVYSAVAPSPNGRWLALEKDFNVYIVPFPRGPVGGEIPEVRVEDLHPAAPARQLSIDGGALPMWSADGKWLSWSWTDGLFRLPYEEAVARSGPIKPRVTQIDMKVPRRELKGHMLLTNARVVTMAAVGSPTSADYKGEPMPTDPKVIERGDILLEGARIKAVGPAGTLKLPKDTKIVDLAGKTIVPGYFALHEHMPESDVGGGGPLVPEQSPRYSAFLANGFMTLQSPNTGYHPMYSDEMVEAGELVGPRIVGGLTDPFYQIRGLVEYAGAEALVRKHKSSGAYLIKEHEGGHHRVQRQWLAMAAAKHGLRLVGHPFKSNVFDGWTEVAHALAREPHRDVRELARRAGTTVELTAIDTYVRTVWNTGKYNAYQIAMLDRGFFPPSNSSFGRELIASMKVPPPGPEPRQLSLRERLELNQQRDEVRRGWSRGAGTDAHIGFMYTHFQVWELVHPEGLTPAEALRLLTLNGARALGLATDLGSIEPGKIDDLVILNSNPLDDIKSTLDIRYIVKTGEVYDSQTLDVLWPTLRKFTMFPWAKKPGEANGAGAPKKASTATEKNDQ